MFRSAGSSVTINVTDKSSDTDFSKHNKEVHEGARRAYTAFVTKHINQKESPHEQKL